MWFHKKPHVSYLLSLGTKIHPHTRYKLEEVVHCDASNAFRVWIHEEQSYQRQRDVLIDENNIV